MLPMANPWNVRNAIRTRQYPGMGMTTGGAFVIHTIFTLNVATPHMQLLA